MLNYAIETSTLPTHAKLKMLPAVSEDALHVPASLFCVRARLQDLATRDDVALGMAFDEVTHSTQRPHAQHGGGGWRRFGHSTRS